MKFKPLIFVIALQVAWILGTVVSQERILDVGKVVLLETQPVDPRDLLRGDFVILNYKINNVPLERFSPQLSTEVPAGTKIYVALASTGTNAFSQVTRASLERLRVSEGEVLLRGKAQKNWQTQSGSVRIEYGLEKYFVAEGTGNPSGVLTVQAAISKSGRASIKEVFIDGKSYVEAMRQSEK